MTYSFAVVAVSATSALTARAVIRWFVAEFLAAATAAISARMILSGPIARHAVLRAMSTSFIEGTFLNHESRSTDIGYHAMALPAHASHYGEYDL